MDKTSNLPSRTKSGFVKGMCVRFLDSKTPRCPIDKSKTSVQADLKSLELAGVVPLNPASFHAGKAAYISGPHLYQLIFSSNKKNDRLYQKTTYNHIHRPNGLGKIHLVLDLIEKECSKHFDYIIIIWPTLRCNKTHHSKDQNDDKVWPIEPKGKLYQWIEKLSQLLAHSDTLSVIDDIIADEELGKKGCPY